MIPSKGFLYFCLAIFFSLTFPKFSFSDTNLPTHQTPSSGKDITIQNNSTSIEDQKNLPGDLRPQSSEIRAQTKEALDVRSEEKAQHPEGNTQDSEPIYDMPITVNKAVEKNIDYFKNSLSERFKSWLERSGRYLSLMREIFREKGLPQDLVFLALIESGFNPYAYSWAKAVGPWQFISSTAKRYGLRVNWWVDERRDPIKSTIAAAEYLKDLYDLFGSWNLALAAYNAGEKKVLKGLRKIKGGDFWDLRDTRYLKRETKEYVPRYMAATIIAKNPEGHGFLVDYNEPLKYDEVTVNSPMDLKVIAKSAGTTIDEIKELNPELKRWCTPPDLPTYRIRIPAGTKETFLANLENLPENERFTGNTYKVKKGDTLNKIAKNFGVSKSIIREANSLGKKYRAKPGDVLFIPSEERYKVIGKAEKPIPKKPNINQQKKIVYRVKKGDSLFKIAQRHNISPEKIKEWNGLKNDKLRPGDKLYIFTSLDPPLFF